MYLDSWIILLSFIIASVQACIKFHSEGEITGEGKLDCMPNGCSLAISPNPTKVTLLTINSFETKTDIYFTTDDSNQKTYWEKASTAMDDRSYSVGPHEGFHLVSKNDNCSAEPRYSFQRVSPENRGCGYSLHYIDNDVKIIQQRLKVQSDTKCFYHLLPMHPTESETLYILSRKSYEVTYKDFDHTEKSTNGEIVALKNWTMADFSKSYEAEYHYYDTPQSLETIQAVTTKRTCACNTKNIKLGSEQLIEFQSPGYPDFLCPSSECKHLVKFLKPNLTDDYVQRVLVTINATSGDQVVLRLNCDCAVFNNKVYNSDQTFQIHVPSHCEMMFCSWTITPNEDWNRKIELRMENGQIGDEVQVWNRDIMENYTSHQLRLPRTIFGYKYSNSTYISFWRKTAGTDATLFVSWNLVSKAGCSNFGNVTLTTTPRAFTSSNYPMFYTHSENCKKLLIAPKKLDGKQDELSITSTGNNMLVHFMSDGYHAKRGFHYVAYAGSFVFKINRYDSETTVPLPSDEPLHDFVNILEDLAEQSRQEDLISGSVAHQHNSTSNYTNVTELNSISPQNSELQQGHGTLFLFSGIFITAIVLIILVIGVLFIKKRIGNSNRQDSFVNSMVTFRSDDNDSIATDGV
ncbi:hypothetical protein CAEBREN_14632 [Caenorhabditis brenneri]|uniref:CUB domain-containing protein n=1 Tax=Caenorhabditis brenneri TaxID=135651 RepID=G0M6M3_CAEBE|nr:hypothetical protein CAEBREN_14632 [Caenorhabditis brenneri]